MDEQELPLTTEQIRSIYFDKCDYYKDDVCSLNFYITENGKVGFKEKTTGEEWFISRSGLWSE